MFARLMGGDRRGTSFVEYIILIGVVGLVAVTGFRMFGGAVIAKIEAQADKVALLEGGSTNGGGGGICIGGVCFGGNNCFVAGTPIATSDGTRPIEQIAVDDQVLSRDERTGEVSLHRVVQTFVTPGEAVVDVHIREAKGDVIRATPGHKFWTADRGWIEAQFLTEGEPLLDAKGATVHVAGVARQGASATVYNIEVEETHTYFVGASAVWVHNPTGPCGGTPTGSASTSGGGAGATSGGGAGATGSGGAGATGSGGAGATGSGGATAGPLMGNSPGAATSPAGTVFSNDPTKTPVAVPTYASDIATNAPDSTTGITKIGKKTKKPSYTDSSGNTYIGTETFKNKGGELPLTDASGTPITYKEYDVHPYTPGTNRGGERIVIGSDGSKYYTNDHYTSFTKL